MLKLNVAVGLACLSFFFSEMNQKTGLKEPVSITVSQSEETKSAFTPGEVWKDVNGEVINAHGGGVLYQKGTYYWYGEIRGERESKGVNVYSSKDLYNWKPEGIALATVSDTASDIVRGSIIERPKVIFNKKTGKYVMWFHLELKGQGYNAARAAVAVSDKPTGPFIYQKSFRPNGHMSRDMGLFVDDDGSAYHIYSAKDNYDLRISKLEKDYLNPSTQDTLLFSKHREAPALFKKDGNYYLITSGCTGWAPNKATLHVSKSLFGPWQLVGDPMSGPDAALTFGGQSTFVLPVQGKKNAFIFMADKWNPKDLKDSRYLWLPIQFKNGTPGVEWKNSWDLSQL
ncbi:glycoside hydrolase family 43 protein [Dyadobacter psychrotolerans]|uniref:Beta-glucanase n=1 Tax=Dyadobacter psychrotolerans TaxID=2541721 RepID=A0A4R5DF70_9BACT|nr:glycoside hydrolase family 43 protein [Dyadobacter psychrotolerans]TDE10521.1 beta-glucanase [Dyadobacter psychrotolerans]